MSAPALPAVGDPSATRTVYATTIVLLLLAIALAVLAVWLFRRTRPEPALFAPLEEMDTRSFRRAAPDARSELLDAARPAKAKPVALTVLTIDGEPDEAAPEDEQGASADTEGSDQASGDAVVEHERTDPAAEADAPPAVADDAAEPDAVESASDEPEASVTVDEEDDEDTAEHAVADTDRDEGDVDDDPTRVRGIARDSTTST